MSSGEADRVLDPNGPAQNPVIATFAVKLTYRGPEGSQVPTIQELLLALYENLSGNGVLVSASAERTDR